MKNKKNDSKNLKCLFQKIFLVIISALLFWLSNPNVFFENGLGWLGWFNYFPIFYLIKKSRLSESTIFGAIYVVINILKHLVFLESAMELQLIPNGTFYI